jgi:hypothetical protein
VLGGGRAKENAGESGEGGEGWGIYAEGLGTRREKRGEFRAIGARAVSSDFLEP